VIGEIVGNFRVIGKLGKGGMGEVWLGEHKEIKTKVAIKMLAEDISTDRQHVDRFFNEAVAVSKIKHAGIVKIFDVGYHERGNAYLIMELLEGESLGARIKRIGRLPIKQVAEIGRQIASVLDATHAEGIIHRDLKPDNVFLIRDAELASGERVKVLDFGIAKLGGATGITAAGGSMGTPSYMPPEQWKASGTVDARADVYAFGCMMFEATCGRPPFVASSVGEACNMHLNEPAPATKSVLGSVPDALDTLYARMLAKSPEQRPAMAEIKTAFAKLGETASGAALDQTLPGSSSPSLAATQDAVSATAPATALPVRPSAPSLAAASAPLDTTLGASAAAVATSAPVRGKPMWPIAVAGVAVAGVAVWFVLLRARGDGGGAAAIDNPFIAIAPPSERVVLGVADDAPAWVNGFRASRGVVAPSEKFAIQAHEVTWGELAPWLDTHPELAFEPPPWARDRDARVKLPVGGIPWATALEYCKSLGGTLPREEQWEYAARGSERRPNPWGAQRTDVLRSRAFMSASAAPQPAQASDQDVTPNGIHDLAGNVQEWTIDLWRHDLPGQDESGAQDLGTGTTIRAIRGLPLAGKPPARPANAPPANDSAAYREPLCASGDCAAADQAHLAYVGFRCVRAQP
jgi:eukaryotic-like serine/threonine-protein kinase